MSAAPISQNNIHVGFYLALNFKFPKQEII